MTPARARSINKKPATLFLVAFVALSVGTATTVQAHPGHGVNPEASATDPIHYLSEPVHALPILALAGFFAARWYRASKETSAETSGS